MLHPPLFFSSSSVRSPLHVCHLHLGLREIRSQDAIEEYFFFSSRMSIDVHTDARGTLVIVARQHAVIFVSSTDSRSYKKVDKRMRYDDKWGLPLVAKSAWQKTPLISHHVEHGNRRVRCAGPPVAKGWTRCLRRGHEEIKCE